MPSETTKTSPYGVRAQPMRSSLADRTKPVSDRAPSTQGEGTAFMVEQPVPCRTCSAHALLERSTTARRIRRRQHLDERAPDGDAISGRQRAGAFLEPVAVEVRAVGRAEVDEVEAAHF